MILKLSDPQDEKGDANFLFLNFFDKDVTAALGLHPLYSPGVKEITAVSTVTEFQDVRWADLRNVDPPLSKALIPTLRFNLDTELGAFAEEGRAILERVDHRDESVSSPRD